MPDQPSRDDASADGHGDDSADVDGSSDSGADANADANQTAEGPPPGTEPADGTGPSPPADSRWWYWVAALPVYYVVGTVVGFLVGFAAFVFALTGAAGDPWMAGPGMGGPWMYAPVGAGVGFLVVLLAMTLFAVGMLLSLLFPAAIYFDAEAVAATTGDWTPDPVLYGLLGLAGVVAQPLQVPLAVYYLYKRHESEGVP